MTTTGDTSSPSNRIKTKRPNTSGKTALVVVCQIAVIAALVGLWQLAAVLGWGRPVLVTSPGAVLEAFVTMASEGLLWPNYWATLGAALVALALAVLIGTPIGLLLGMLPFTAQVMNPIINALNGTPRIALAPVFIVIFGINASSKIALAFTLGVFVMILNAQAGMRAADSEVVRMLTVMGASKAKIVWTGMLPYAVPSLLAGVRLTIIFSLLGVVSQELIASRDGLGQLIARSAAAFDMASTYAVLILLVITAAILNLVGDQVEKRLLKWQPPRVR
ncbi:MAG: ABC transporter permease [Mycetocola sp.]